MWTKHAFVYDSHYKHMNKADCCGVLIDNRADAPICVLENKDRDTMKRMKCVLRQFFEGICHVEHVYKTTPCGLHPGSYL